MKTPTFASKRSDRTQNEQRGGSAQAEGRRNQALLPWFRSAPRWVALTGQVLGTVLPRVVVAHSRDTGLPAKQAESVFLSYCFINIYCKHPPACLQNGAPEAARRLRSGQVVRHDNDTMARCRCRHSWKYPGKKTVGLRRQIVAGLR